MSKPKNTVSSGTKGVGGHVVVDRPTDSILPNPDNTRRHTAAQSQKIANCILRFGFVVPILIDENGMIIAGHGRLEAARLLGLKHVPTLAIEYLNDAEKAAYAIADNRLSELSEFDDRRVAEQLKVLSELNFDLDVIGFEMGEIDFRIESLKTPLEKETLEFVPPVSGPAVTQIGDQWHLGASKVLCADALKLESYSVLMQRERAKMIFADPPYNVAIAGNVGGRGKIKHQEFVQGSGMSVSQFTEFLKQFLRYCRDVSTDGSLHYICMDWRHLRELLEAGYATFENLLNLCVWAKDNAGMGSFYRSQHELVLVFKKERPPHQNNIQLGVHGRNRSNIWSYPGMNSFSRNTKEGNLLAIHPTVKPVALVADAILDASARGDIILDPFLGSGTTLIAAQSVGRRCFGLELDPRYVDTIIRRWQALTGEPAFLSESDHSFDDILAGRVAGR